MDSMLVVLATGLVAHKYMVNRNKKVAEEEGEGLEQQQPVGQGFPEALGAARLDTERQEAQKGRQVTGSYALNGRPGTMSVPEVSETALRRKQVQDEGLEGFHEQFFPQDTRATGFSVTQKPWMRAVQNSETAVPRTEKEAAFPTKADREDVHNTSIINKLRDFENLQTQRTIPRSREKHFESPVESISTQNEGGGGLRGQRQLQRYHKFLLNEEPRLETSEGPRGNFTGANRSGLNPDNQLDNSRPELVISHTGVPVSASFKVGIPDKSFELEGSNAEAWNIDEHLIPAGSRAPVEQSSSLKPSFQVAHDEGVEAFAVCRNANMMPRSKAADIDNNESQLKDHEIETQTVLGAPGGSRLQANNTESNFKPKAKDEALSLGASKVEFMSSSRSSGPGALVSKQSHEHTEEKLAEEDTAGRVRGVTFRTKNDVRERSIELNDSKNKINDREFTSQNLAAPQNKSLPPHLRIAPTSTITATTDMTLKDNAVETLAQDPITRGAFARDSAAKFSPLPVLGESTPEQRRMKLTRLNHQMASGEALTLLSNPYTKPSNRLQIHV